MLKKQLNDLYNNSRRIRSAKNFLGVLGRSTLRLGIRNHKNLVQRAVAKVRRADDILHRIAKPPKRRPRP